MNGERVCTETAGPLLHSLQSYGGQFEHETGVSQLRGLVNDGLLTEFNCHLAFAIFCMVKLIITFSRRGYPGPTLAETSVGEGLHVNDRLLSPLFYCSQVFRAKKPNLLIDLAFTSHLH